MRLVIQRVTNAEVAVPAEGYLSSIGHGLLVLAAFCDEDTQADLEWCTRKLVAMRIFEDQDGVMNLSVQDVDGVKQEALIEGENISEPLSLRASHSG